MTTNETNDYEQKQQQEESVVIDSSTPKKIDKVKKILFICNLVAAFLGSAIFLIITIVGAATYGRVYYFDGYEYTKALCGLALALMLLGLCGSVAYLILNISSIKQKAFLKKLILSAVAIVLCIAFSATLFAFIGGGTKSSTSSSTSSSGSGSTTISKSTYMYYYMKIDNVKVESNSSYTICTGRVTNNGSYTIYYVQVRGAFKNYSGTTLDTDWTYAVGSEGLRPGESTTFRMSVHKNSSIYKCDVTFIYD